MDKAEIQRELDHVNKVLKIAHDNRRALEQQQIQQGMIAPLNLINQMNEIKSAIQELEERKNNLEIQSVEEDYSLAEAEYQVIAARAWKDGLLNVIGGSELQLSRLKLKIPKQRADQIEQEIRTELTRSIFRAFSINVLWSNSISANKDMLKLTYKLINLNHREFVDMICRSLEISEITPKKVFSNHSSRDDKISKNDLKILEKNVISANNMVFDSDLTLLRDAIQYLTNQLDAKGLLANPS